ncbi:hypothetical protein ACTI_29880 [Actinoplanes sp. OR16]|uniref:hypothetical protein n=1 Tax=Actinoplanes sp. OR16 TaxID=946334 RepID=UPI000F6CFCDC|nr:hypothetical protein [Actinoplanes sp. OR16]BBH66303.1 hypothetical protein ACTI_29880 [Actinoplanes sp. OR16]
MGNHVNQGWQNLDGNGHYWPSQPQGMPPSYAAHSSDPLVSPDFAGWWGRSSALVPRIWKPSLILHAIIAVPTFAMALPARTYLEREQNTFAAALEARPTELPPIAGLVVAIMAVMVVSLIGGALYLVTTAACVQLTVQAATGRPVSLGGALRTGLRRTPALFGWGVLAALLGFVAILLCVLPVFYVAAALAVLPVVVTVERGVGIGRCFQLFHADLGASLGRVATIYGVAIGAALCLGVVSVIVQATAGALAGSVTDVLLNGAFTVAFGVVSSPFLVTAYADMRARREPFSTAHLMTV